MEIKFYGKNIKITNAMKAYVANKAEHLRKLTQGCDAELVVRVEVHKERQIADMVLTTDGKTFTASSERDDFYDAVLASLDKLKRKVTESR